MVSGKPSQIYRVGSDLMTSDPTAARRPHVGGSASIARCLGLLRQSGVAIMRAPEGGGAQRCAAAPL